MNQQTQSTVLLEPWQLLSFFCGISIKTHDE